MAGQYCQYMKNDFWREMSARGMLQDNSRYYEPVLQDPRYTPLFIHAGDQYALHHKRYWQGPASYRALLPEGPNNTGPILQSLQTCVNSTGDPRRCAQLLPFRKCC